MSTQAVNGESKKAACPLIVLPTVHWPRFKTWEKYPCCERGWTAEVKKQAARACPFYCARELEVENSLSP